jgi:hypothetical protein
VRFALGSLFLVCALGCSLNEDLDREWPGPKVDAAAPPPDAAPPPPDAAPPPPDASAEDLRWDGCSETCDELSDCLRSLPAGGDPSCPAARRAEENVDYLQGLCTALCAQGSDGIEPNITIEGQLCRTVAESDAIQEQCQGAGLCEQLCAGVGRQRGLALCFARSEEVGDLAPTRCADACKAQDSDFWSCVGEEAVYGSENTPEPATELDGLYQLCDLMFRADTCGDQATWGRFDVE